MCKVIAIINLKGGVGKSTITPNLGESLRRSGNSVLLVDGDPQGTLRDWSASCEEEDGLGVIGLDRPDLHKQVSNLKNEYDYILIDGCPQNGQLAISSIKAADVVLIPVTPSPYDAWACSKLVELIKSRQEITEGVPITRFLISRSIKNTLLDVDVRKILDEYGIEILKSQTTQRQVYPQVAALGKTVFWSSNKNACNEIDSIRKEVERLALFSS